ncbi:MAG: substrate-binding domain-containing protein [Candidatus Acidiferrales bacterium]
MKKLKLILSIPSDTMYLRAQTAAAQAVADRLGIELDVINAGMDSVAQGQQLLDIVLSKTAPRPAGILVEPVSAAGLPRVAEAAVAAGVAWVVNNAHVDYLSALRRNPKVPVFQISQDHVEVGKIQGRQIGAILSGGGSVLYLRGPAMSWWATRRLDGLDQAKPKNIEVKALKVIGSSAENAYTAVCSWLSLTHPKPESIQLIVSQNADFAHGARKAFETTSVANRPKWLAIPRAGVGVAERSRPLVDQGLLCASVVTSLTMDRAVEMLARSLADGSQPPEHTFVEAYSYPSVEDLATRWKGAVLQR